MDASYTTVGFTGSSLATILDKVRARMAVDLPFTLRTIFGKTFLDAPFHTNYAQFCWEDDLHHRTLELAPRGGGKSTIGKGKMAAVFLLNPDARQLLVSFAQDQAISFLRNIFDEYILYRPRDNTPDWIDLLFPDVRAAVRSTDRRRDVAFFPTLNATGQGDPHFKAAGIDTGITGLHMRIEVDDLIDEVAARSPTECARAVDWYETSINCLPHQVTGDFHVRGTHYHLRDPYAHIAENHPEAALFIQGGINETYFSDGSVSRESYWPSRFSLDDMAAMRQSMGSYRYAALIDQNPTQHEGAPFQQKFLRHWTWATEGKAIIRGSDNAKIHISELTIGIIYDPALPNEHSRAETAIMCVAMDSDGNYYVLEPWAEKVSVEQGISTFIAMGTRWDPDVMACEDVLFQSLLIPHMQRDAKTNHIAAYNIQGVAPEGRSKPIRILSLQSIYESGRLFCHPSHAKFITQLLTYPYGKKCDLLDALAYAPRILYPPLRTTVNIGGREVPRSSLIKSQERSRITGY